MPHVTPPFENDPSLLKEVLSYFTLDAFAFETCSINVEAVAEGHAFVSIEAAPHLANAKGGMQGGAIFTMADLAGAIADYRRGEVNTTIDGSIQYLKPPKSKIVYAHAYATRRGSRVGYYRVDICDAENDLVACAQLSYLHWKL